MHAVEVDKPVMTLDDALDEAEAETRAVDVARFFQLHAVERLEQIGLLCHGQEFRAIRF